MNADFHDTICHTDPGDNKSQTRVDKGVLCAMQGLATFLGYMSGDDGGIRDGPRQLGHLRHLRHRLGQGPRHVRVAGPPDREGRRTLKGDQHLRFPGQNLSSILLTIANMFGAGMTSIGMGGGMTNQELTGVRLA